MDFLKIPKHVAIIMDGNGRWAEKLGKPRSFGHAEGIKNIEKVVKCASNLNVKYLTLYAFSTENWNRPKLEVDFLMSAFKKKLENLIEDKELNFKYKLLGSRPKIPKSILDFSDSLEKKTESNRGVHLNIAFNYGSRQEIMDAAIEIAKDYKSDKLNDLNEDIFSTYLYTSGQPDVDLLIRTGKEKRLSNFLLWQSSYAEIIFSDVLWPEFSEFEFDKCIEEFGKRKRKFGKV